MAMTYLGIGYWWMLLLAPLVVGIFGIVIERTLLRWIYKLDHLYGLLLTLGDHLADRRRVPFHLRGVWPGC